MILTEASLLRDLLDSRLAISFPNFRSQAESSDPLGLVYPYSRREDAEVVALLASSLAYGQRKVFVPLVSRILKEMGHSPYDFVMSSGYKSKFDWFKYRFNIPEDLWCLFHATRQVLNCFGSLESAFIIDAEHVGSIGLPLGSFVNSFRSVDFSSLGVSASGTPGFRYLLPDPSLGGACKRLNMFLRWMVRKDSVDLGLWSGLRLSDLIVPLDTHVHHVSKKLGLTDRNGSTWATASSITNSLKLLDPVDPLKYDFLLFSMGVGNEL